MKEFLDTYREKFILDIKDFLKQDERNGFLIKRIPQMNIFVVMIYVMKKKMVYVETIERVDKRFKGIFSLFVKRHLNEDHCRKSRIDIFEVKLGVSYSPSLAGGRIRRIKTKMKQRQ